MNLYELGNFTNNYYKVKVFSDKPASRSNDGYCGDLSFVTDRQSLDEIRRLLDDAIAQVNDNKRRIEETVADINGKKGKLLEELVEKCCSWQEEENTALHNGFWDAMDALDVEETTNETSTPPANDTANTTAATNEKTPDVSEKRKKPKRRHKKRDFVIKLKSRSCDGFPAVVYRFKVIGEVDTLCGVNFNAYIVMPLDNCLSYVYELTRTDCDMLGIRWQDGIALMSKNLDWIIPPDLKKQQREKEQKKNNRISDWDFDPFGRMIF